MYILEISVLIIFIIIGYKICYHINYLPQQGQLKDLKKQYLILTWNSQDYHIHHWISFTIIIIMLFIGRYTSRILFVGLIGLSVGCVLEGFLFDDWHQIKVLSKVN